MTDLSVQHQREQHALTRKQERETLLGKIPTGRKTGEASALVKTSAGLHALLIVYDKLANPPALADTYADLFTETVARLAEVTKPKLAPPASAGQGLSMPKKRRPPFSLDTSVARTPGPLRMSDDYRAPFPGFTPASVLRARYLVTPLGRVYRDDGHLMAVGKDLTVRFNSGRAKRSLPRAVYNAFGNVEIPAGSRLWVPPAVADDELTGRPSCALEGLRIVRRTEFNEYRQGNLRLSQLRLRPVYRP